MPDTSISIDIDESYSRLYRMRSAGADGRGVEVSLPRDVVRRAASREGLTVPEFVERFRAKAVYNGFNGVYYQFVPA